MAEHVRVRALMPRPFPPAYLRGKNRLIERIWRIQQSRATAYGRPAREKAALPSTFHEWRNLGAMRPSGAGHADANLMPIAGRRLPRSWAP